MDARVSGVRLEGSWDEIVGFAAEVSEALIAAGVEDRVEGDDLASCRRWRGCPWRSWAGCAGRASCERPHPASGLSGSSSWAGRSPSSSAVTSPGS
jgi:hypothetical protein